MLTEPEYFKGRDHYLTEIRQAVSVPLLRKDFTVDEYQLYEARLLGADAVLLIAALLIPIPCAGISASATGWDCRLWWRPMMRRRCVPPR